ncbi:MAG: hypothetical protein QM647_06750 [Asticcacaulis sp.]|uniref:hypothetical protein n=1 Tax=Asticcacaulis sp. TaxID=1872648 RepID=UPI0039E39FD7
MSKSTNYLAAGLTKTLATALAAILLATTPAAHAMSKNAVIEAQQATKMARMRVLFQQAVNKINQEDYEAAEEEFTFIINDADFTLLSPELKYAVYGNLAAAQSERQKYDEAYANLMQIASVAPDFRDEYYWYLLWKVSTHLKKYGDAIDAMTTLATTSPEDISGYYEPYIYQTVNNAKDLPDGDARREKALEALWAAKYKPGGYYSAEGLWFSLFRIKVAKGDTARAKELAQAFQFPATYISLQVDKRYRSYAEADPAHFNLKSLIDKAVEDSRARSQAHPRELEGINALIFDLMDANRLSEALALADDTLARATAAPANKPAFDDMDDQWHWFLNTRTRVLEKLGRYAESEASQIQSRDESLAKNDDVVSQRINLGAFYYEQGRPQEALEQVKGIVAKDSSPYGLMAAEEVRACAYAQLNDQANLTKSLEYIRAHAKDGYGPARAALLCTGDVDGLATLTIRRLDDPEDRNDALQTLQNYRPEPYQTAIEKQMNQVAAAVVAREDVKAAVARYGYIDSYDFPSPYN